MQWRYYNSHANPNWSPVSIETYQTECLRLYYELRVLKHVPRSTDLGGYALVLLRSIVWMFGVIPLLNTPPVSSCPEYFMTSLKIERGSDNYPENTVHLCHLKDIVSSGKKLLHYLTSHVLYLKHSISKKSNTVASAKTIMQASAQVLHTGSETETVPDAEVTDHKQWESLHSDADADAPIGSEMSCLVSIVDNLVKASVNQLSAKHSKIIGLMNKCTRLGFEVDAKQAYMPSLSHATQSHDVDSTKVEDLDDDSEVEEGWILLNKKRSVEDMKDTSNVEVELSCQHQVDMKMDTLRTSKRAAMERLLEKAMGLWETIAVDPSIYVPPTLKEHETRKRCMPIQEGTMEGGIGRGRKCPVLLWDLRNEMGYRKVCNILVSLPVLMANINMDQTLNCNKLTSTYSDGSTVTNGVETFCWCHGADDGSAMTCCDGPCQLWFHDACMGVDHNNYDGTKAKATKKEKFAPCVSSTVASRGELPPLAVIMEPEQDEPFYCMTCTEFLKKEHYLS